MNIKKIITLLLLVLLASAFFADSAWADSYEEEPRIDLSVDKKIASESGGFVDHFGVDDYHFQAEDKIFFEIKVTNSSDEDLENVEVKDTFPEYVVYVSGLGSWNASDKTLSWTIDSLKKGETKRHVVSAKIVSRDQLFEGVGTRCDIDSRPIENRARAWKDEKWDEDTAKFCIEKKVLEKKIPEAGPADTSLILFASILAGLVGWAKLKESN